MVRTSPLLSLAFYLTAVTSARAGDVTTIAGTDNVGFSGDGGLALVAELNDPFGIAVAPDGTIYFADNGNFRIRKIDPAGTITTIVGNGSFGDTGDGGPAVDATISGVLSVALDPSATLLYFADIDNNFVRQVDLVTGIISFFAGSGIFGFGFDGDGGPATLAKFAFPGYVAVDSAGNVYITDTFNNRIRKVDPVTGIITTFAGNGGTATAGDGGLATSASLGSLRALAIDGYDNVFLVDGGGGPVPQQRVRAIEAVTGIIVTVAGGGSTLPGFGAATAMDLGGVNAIAVDGGGQLFIASDFHQVFQVDLASDLLSVFAGTGVPGNDGDGGPALFAAFFDLGGAAFLPTGELLVSGYHRNIRSIEPDPLVIPSDVVISLTTSQAFLDLIQGVLGSVIMINVDGNEFLIIPNMTSVGLDVTLADNDQLLIIDLGALESVGGDIDITGNLALTTLDLSALTNVGGSLTITGDPSLTALLISGVTSVGGDLTIIGTAATVIDLPALTEVVGSINVSGNVSSTTIDLGNVTSAGGDINVSGNGSATTIDLGNVTSAGGDINVSGNVSSTTIDLGNVTSAGGDINVSGNGSATTIDLGNVTSAGGDINVSGNVSSTTIDLGNVTSAGDDINVSGNVSSTTIDLGNVTSAGGDINVSGNGSATTIDLGNVTSAGGDINVSGNVSSTTIDLGNVTSAGGGADVSGNTSATGINLGALESTGGGVDVSGNTSATGVDLGSLTTAGGGVDVSGNTSETGVDLGSLTSVNGNLTVETSGSGSFDVTGAAVFGDTNLTTNGYTTVAGTTAAGSTAVSLGSAETIMSAQIGPATFVTPVDFAITQFADAALPPESGTAAGGGAATVDPVAACELTFGVPTLAHDANLTFDVLLGGLPPATSAAVLAALEAGTLTMATKGTAPGSTWQAFPLCTGVEVPTADGCVLVQTLDAEGEPTTGTPAVLRFTNVVGHFSTWAVVITSDSPWTNLGHALGGALGTPVLTGQGILQPGTPLALQLSGANPLSAGAWVVGLQELDLPILSGVLVPTPDYVLPLSTDLNGAAGAGGTWWQGATPGWKLVFQAWILDPGAPELFAASNGLAGTTP